MANAIRASTGAAALLLLATACGGSGGGETTQAKPAERHLVYIRGPSPASASVWIADADGAHPHRLAADSTGVPSPDGRTVAVARPGKGIYLVSSDGKQVRRLTPRRLQPRGWSPDGEVLIATAQNSQAVTQCSR